MRVQEVFPELQNPIVYYPELVAVCGSINAALYLAQLFYWTGKQQDPNGWIFKRVRHRSEADPTSAAAPEQSLLNELGMTSAQERTARKKLLQRDFIEARYSRTEHRLYLRLNLEALRRAAAQYGLGPGSVPAGAGHESLLPEVKDRDQAGHESAPGRSGILTSLIGTSESTTETTTEGRTQNAKGVPRPAPTPGGSRVRGVALSEDQLAGWRAQACEAFEAALEVRGWPWRSSAAWKNVADLVSAAWQQEPGIFRAYAQWIESDRSHTGMRAKQIRNSPQQFIDTGWPLFLASRKRAPEEPEAGESEMARRVREWEAANGAEHQSAS